MAHMKPLPPETTPELQGDFDIFDKILGFVPNSLLTMQRRPKMVKGFGELTKGVMDPDGSVAFWDYHVYFAGRRGCWNFYEIPNHRVAAHGEWRIGPGIHPFAVGPWRAPAANTNTYARDLQINIMASKAGKDPLAFRLSHLKDKRMRGVLEAAAKQFGWTTVGLTDMKSWSP